MNKEELLKDAKLFLGQYAEHLADTLGYLKSNLENDEKIFRIQQGGWYEELLRKRIKERKSRKEILVKKLTRLDEVRLAI